MKTYAPRPRDIERRWYVVDAEGAVLGRLASEVAKILRGKNKPIFAPHADTGDHVVVVNARGVVLSGAKRETKQYHHHSGYPGGLRSVDYARLLSERPSLAVERAVKGMLPKNRLGRKMFAKLSVYDGAEHPHAAQKPAPLALGELPRWEGLPAAPEPSAEEPEKAAEPKARSRRPAPKEAAPAAKAPAKRPSRGSRAKSSASRAPASGTAGTRKGSSRTRTSAGGSSSAAKTTTSAGEKKAPARTRRKKNEEES